MGIVEGQLKAAKRALLSDAGERWMKREEERTEGLAKVEKLGPGAADSPVRQMQFALRQASKAMQGLPRFGERIIGTRDLLDFSPSPEATAAAAAVARITSVPDATHEAQGFATGMLLPGGLLLTNYHVFPTEAYAVGCAANFGYVRDERGVRPGIYFELEPGAFFHSNATFDFALVSVKPKGLKGEDLTSLGATQLIESTGKVLVGLGLNIVQHPGGGVRQYAVSNNRLLDILTEGYLHYETDTEPGSSGSKVTNTDWELVALHHSGVPKMENGRILRVGGGFWDEKSEDDSDILWVANEGVRVSRIVEELKKVQLPDPTKQARLNGLLSATADPFESTLGGGVPPITPVGMQGGFGMSANNVFNLSGPVTVHVYAPAAPMAPATPLPVTSDVQAFSLDVAVEKSLVFDPAYEARSGYVPDFLGVRIDLPTVDAARQGELYTVGDYSDFFDEYRDVPELPIAGLPRDQALELKYHHYSLVQNKKFLMCMWTASNCDYRADQRLDTRKRSALGGENWRADPRVPLDFQLIDDDIYKPGKRIDRGHIVRREDNCWGPAGLPTDYANSDTYHYPNCTPQHEAFNQENPSNKQGSQLYTGSGQKGIWGQFEGQLAKAIEAGGGQAVLFAGPVLADFFPPVQVAGRELLLPRKFWKVVVVADGLKKNARLKAYGYLFNQSDVVKTYGFGLEGLALPTFDRNRITFAELQALTGVVLPANVLAAEQPKSAGT